MTFQILLAVTFAGVIHTGTSIRTFDTFEACEEVRLGPVDVVASEAAVGRSLAAQGVPVEAIASKCAPIGDPS